MIEPTRGTPKRKRGEPEPEASPIFTTRQLKFDFGQPDSEEDGNASPRSRVAHKFQGLALEGGGGVTGQVKEYQHDESDEESTPEDTHEGLAIRKRQKVPEAAMTDVDAVGSPVGMADSGGSTVPEPTLESPTSKNRTKMPDGLRLSHVTISRPSELNPRSRKRAGTPPLVLRRSGKTGAVEGEEEAEIVDPIRAALTWHEDEITVYDPDDDDDDGTGINGIGFKPTPALAYARTQKRKQQLAEYRKREESEARARRNRRRRGSPSATRSSGIKSPERKVRFTDIEQPSAVVTTG
jgi:hypothetical protein